jgi:hypothetical protein
MLSLRLLRRVLRSTTFRVSRLTNLQLLAFMSAKVRNTSSNNAQTVSTMEKRQYTTPWSEIVYMESEGFLCASTDFEDGDLVNFNPGDAGDDEGF